MAAAFLVQPVPAPVELDFLALLAAPGLCGLAIGAAAMRLSDLPEGVMSYLNSLNETDE